MLIIADPSTAGIDEKRLRGEVQGCLDSASVDLKVVKHIPQEASGKYLLVRSRSFEPLRCVRAVAGTRA
jgi:hypothetical protein